MEKVISLSVRVPESAVDELKRQMNTDSASDILRSAISEYAKSKGVQITLEVNKNGGKREGAGRPRTKTA